MFIPASLHRRAEDAEPDPAPHKGPSSDTVTAIVVAVVGFVVICGLAVAVYFVWKKTRREDTQGRYLQTPTRPSRPTQPEPLTRNRDARISIDRYPSSSIDLAAPIAADALTSEPENTSDPDSDTEATRDSRDPRGRPVLRVVTRSASAASRLSTEVVVHHADDGGVWQVDWPLMREKPKQMRAPRKRSERNAEGRRVVKELIPPKYDPSWGSLQPPAGSTRSSQEIMDDSHMSAPVQPASHIP